MVRPTLSLEASGALHQGTKAWFIADHCFVCCCSAITLLYGNILLVETQSTLKAAPSAVPPMVRSGKPVILTEFVTGRPVHAADLLGLPFLRRLRGTIAVNGFGYAQAGLATMEGASIALACPAASPLLGHSHYPCALLAVLLGYTIVATLLLSVVTSGYWAFGAAVQPLVLDSIGKPVWLVVTANFLVVVNSLAGYLVSVALFGISC